MSKLLRLEVRKPRRYSEFDISKEMGFFPSSPLQRLPLAFDFWECALSVAPSTLSLGSDISDEAVAKRKASELWRQKIREVSHYSYHPKFYINEHIGTRLGSFNTHSEH